MSYYNRDLQEVAEPVEFYVVQHQVAGHDGMPRVEFIPKAEYDPEDLPANIYHPWLVTVENEEAASKWQALYKSCEIRDNEPNRSPGLIEEDNEQSEKDRKRMNELEEAGKLAEAKWWLLVNAPTIVGNGGQGLQLALDAFEKALRSAEVLGFQPTDEDQEHAARKEVRDSIYAGLYILAARLATLEERYFPQPTKVVEEVIPTPALSHSKSSNRPASVRPRRPVGERAPRPARS